MSPEESSDFSENIGSPTAQQLMCAYTSAVMHLHNTCYADVAQLMCNNIQIIF